MLNDSGVVVERADENHELPRRWDNGTCTDMDLPAGTTDLIGVRAINNAGYAVGTVRTGDPIKALMWRPDGSVVTLDSLLPAGSPWRLQFAQTINDRGDIAGIGLLDGVRTAFLFSNRTFVVNDAGDDDDAALDGVCDADAETAGEQCTLRAAIEEVNETTDSEPVAVTFAIPAPARPRSPRSAPCPPIRRPVMLDGRTQPGGGVRIDGAAAGPDVDGLTLDREATGSEVHGLTVTRFDGHGLRVRANDAVVQGNVLGAPVACAAPCTLGNRGSGVLVDGVAGVVVGRSVQQLLDGASDAVAGEPNVIAHNGGDGVTVGSVGTNDGDDVAWNRFAGNAGLPIELGADGRTLNDDRDGDGGANELLNSPVVTAARIETRAGVRRLKGGGGLTGIPNRLPSVVLYATTACTDPARPSDLIPLATATVLSGKLGLDAAGQGSWEADLDLSAQPADHVTLAAAAVTASGTTSESSNCVRDTDGDSLNDPWEEDGADPDGDGVVEVPLDDMGATVGRKDVFVEIDSMPANPVTETGLDLVRAAFADAPLDNPDGTSGMQIHLDNGPGSEMTRPLDGGARRAWAGLSDHDVLTSDEPLDVRDLELGTDRASIEPVHAIKREHFRWSRRFFFHYLLSARAIRANGFLQTGDTVVRSTQSAFAIGTFQDDTAAIATYGGLEDDLRTPLAHAGLVMTGVGTMLGIGPGGGGDPFGGKPNYLSVANPLFTWGLVERGTDEVVFDYSRAGAPADAAAGGSLLPLDERHLDETRGVGATGSVTRYVSAFVCPPAFSTRPFEPRPELRKIDDLAGPVDWDCAGGPTGTDVQANVNFDLRPNYEAGSLNPIYSPLLPREDWTTWCSTAARSAAAPRPPTTRATTARGCAAGRGRGAGRGRRDHQRPGRRSGGRARPARRHRAADGDPRGGRGRPRGRDGFRRPQARRARRGGRRRGDDRRGVRHLGAARGHAPAGAAHDRGIRDRLGAPALGHRDAHDRRRRRHARSGARPRWRPSAAAARRGLGEDAAAVLGEGAQGQARRRADPVAQRQCVRDPRRRDAAEGQAAARAGGVPDRGRRPQDDQGQALEGRAARAPRPAQREGVAPDPRAGRRRPRHAHPPREAAPLADRPEPPYERQQQKARGVLAGQRRDPVPGAGDHDAVPALERLQRVAGDLVGLEPRHVGDQLVGAAEAARLAELGPHRARADGGQRDAGAAHLLVQRLGEREHERLRRAVGGLERHRLEGDQRGEVEHGALSPLGHRGEEVAGERDDRLAVGGDHRRLLGLVELGEAPAAAVAGVVDQHLDGQPAAVELAVQAAAAARVGDVGADRLGAHAVGVGELLGQLDQPVLAAGDERHAVAALGQPARQLRADPRRGAGDQAGRVVTWRREAHTPARTRRPDRRCPSRIGCSSPNELAV